MSFIEILILLFILFVIFISIYSFVYYDICNYFFDGHNITQLITNYIINNIKNDGPKNEILLTVPHNCINDNKYILKHHYCDIVAGNYGKFLHKSLKEKNITTDIILSDILRIETDNNRIEAIDSNIDPNIYENINNIAENNKSININIPNNYSTKFWNVLTNKIINKSIKMVIDVHSYDDNILSDDINTNFAIFVPQNMNTVLRRQIRKYEKKFYDNNIITLNVCPNNNVNAITDFCNKIGIPSFLIEINETRSDLNIKHSLSILIDFITEFNDIYRY